MYVCMCLLCAWERYGLFIRLETEKRMFAQATCKYKKYGWKVAPLPKRKMIQKS